MFPIPSGRKLSFVEIAKYWSREISPSASPQELRDAISKAWWRGELVAANGLSRLSVLRGYYLKSADFIAFVVLGMEEPPQWRSVNDGAVEFVRPLRVPLSNADSKTWTDANCAEAFEAVAEQWNEAIISPSTPIFLDVVLTQTEFLKWIDTYGYKRPTFWGNASEAVDEQQPADNTAQRILSPTKRRPTLVQYAEHVKEVQKQGKNKVIPTREEDIEWARQNSFTIDFVRGELRRQYIAGLSGPERKSASQPGRPTKK